jgi:hypothetical protein
MNRNEVTKLLKLHALHAAGIAKCTKLRFNVLTPREIE